MAHIHSLASQVFPNPGYTSGRRDPDGATFPSTAVFSGFNSPGRFEASLLSLSVTGTIPREIDGTFYRIQPDHRFPPLYEDDIHFNGDGAVTAIKLHGGHADLQHKYVQTDRFKAETAARKALFGRYRNLYTDDESVRGVIRTVANTNVVFWRGVLLAMKEDGPPYALDPTTLETLGRWDFDGQLTSPTFTAHPKFDPRTQEMVCFGYEAGGNGNDGSREICVFTLDIDGRKVEECWYEAPFCGMIHDCGLSENWLVLPLTPLKCDLERLKRGGNHWAWDPDEDQWYGVVPRRGGRREDIKWFRSDNAFHGHAAGCYELPNGHIVFDLTVADGNVFFFFPPDNHPPGSLPKRNALKSSTQRWIFNPKAPSGTRVYPNEVWDTSGEFSRIDDRFVTRPYEHFWQARIDSQREYDFEACGSPAGGLFNCLGHYTWSSRSEDVYWAGPCATFQEPTFIPREGGGEGEGWLVALVNRLDVLRNDVVVLDAQNLAAGPVAIIHMPFKLRLGLHGNWVDAREVGEWERRKEGGGRGVANGARERRVSVAGVADPLAWRAESMDTSNGVEE